MFFTRKAQNKLTSIVFSMQNLQHKVQQQYKLFTTALKCVHGFIVERSENMYHIETLVEIKRNVKNVKSRLASGSINF